MPSLGARWTDQAVPCNSSASKVLAGFLLLLGCATDAPPLPPDTSSINSSGQRRSLTAQEQALSCDALKRMKADADRSIDEVHHHVQGHRQRDQALAYFGTLLFVPLLAASKPNEEATQLSDLYSARDRVLVVESAKRCHKD